MNKFFWLKTHGIEAGFGGGGFGREGFDQGPDFGGLDPGSGAAGAGGQGIGGAGIGQNTDSAVLGETFAAPESVTRQDLGEFSSFVQQTSGLFGNLQELLGFGPDVTAAVKRGAEISDPAAFSAGQKAGVGFELAGALASFGGLPASAAVGVVDRVISAVQNPAFGVGRQSIENRLSAAAPAAGAATGMATQSLGLARAVELGLNLAGVATAGVGADIFQAENVRDIQTPGGEDTGAGSTEPRLRQEQEQRGALVSSTTRDIQRNLGAVLPERERFSRADLRIGSA